MNAEYGDIGSLPMHFNKNMQIIMYRRATGFFNTVHSSKTGTLTAWYRERIVEDLHVAKMSIHKLTIQSHSESLGTRGIRQLSHDVAVRAVLHAVVVPFGR